MHKIIGFVVCITAVFNSCAIPRVHGVSLMHEQEKNVVVDALSFKMSLKIKEIVTVAALKRYIEFKTGIPVCEQALYVRTQGIFFFGDSYFG